MTSRHEPLARSADTTSPDLGSARPRGRRVAALLAGAVPLAAAALAAAPVTAAFAAAAPPAAAHAPAMLTGSGCLARVGVHQAPKIPACLGD